MRKVQYWHAEIQALKDFLDGGTTGIQKSLLIAGDDIGYFHGRTASTTYDSVFYSGYLHAQYFLDDGNGTPDQHRICGVAVNPGLCDSISSSFPDGIGVINGSVIAYRFSDLSATSDTVVSVAFDGTTYNVLYHAFEFREIVQPVLRKRKSDYVRIINLDCECGRFYSCRTCFFRISCYG